MTIGTEEPFDLDQFYSVVPIGDWKRIIGDALHYHFGYFRGSEDLETGLRRTVWNFYPYITPGSHILDVGCGWGGPANMLIRERDCAVTGITCSTAQADYCRHLGLKVIRHDLDRDVEEIPGEYDLIFSLEMISHVRNKLEHLCRLRASAPRLILSESCAADWYKGERATYGGSIMLCTVSELIHDVEAAGWEIKFMRNRRFESLRTVALWKQNLDRVYGDREPLDVGCGDGSFLRVATRCGWCAIGLDPDVNAVASCRSNALAVLHGGIELFDAMENRFDVITLNHVIEHVPDPVELLRSCYRLLKPGGQLWLQTPNIDSLGSRRYGRHWRGLEPPRHLVLFNPASLRLALHHARFQRFDRRFVPNPIAWIVKRSEEIRRGIPNDGSVKLSGAQRLFLTTARIRQAVSLSLNEALTVIAYKNGRFA